MDKQILVGDFINRRADRTIWHRLVFLAQHIADQIDRLLGGAEEDPAIMVHIDSNGRGRWSIIKMLVKKLQE